MEEVLNFLKRSRSGKRVVLATGCFDILHTGHVKFLDWAKTHGDILIVGVNSDAYVSFKKGPMRPINQEESRKTLISRLDMVNYAFVTKYNRENLVTTLQPNVLIINASDKEHSRQRIDEAQELRKKFPNIDFVVTEKSFGEISTTGIVKKIQCS